MGDLVPREATWLVSSTNSVKREGMALQEQTPCYETKRNPGVQFVPKGMMHTLYAF